MEGGGRVFEGEVFFAELEEAAAQVGPLLNRRVDLVDVVELPAGLVDAEKVDFGFELWVPVPPASVRVVRDTGLVAYGAEG